jgi:rubredoxin
MFLFTSIVIEKDLSGYGGYNILYAKNFNPNTVTYLTYATNVRKEVIPSLLVELSKLYFRQLNPEKEPSKEVREEVQPRRSVAPVFQCSNCLTLYDPKYGDALGNVPPGVLFNDLPDTYRCHVCDTEKKYFTAVIEG